MFTSSMLENKDVLNEATIKELYQSISVCVDEYKSIPNEIIQMANKLLIKKFTNKYASINQYDNLEEILQKVWSDYSIIYEFLDSDINKVNNNRLIYFEEMNKRFEVISNDPLISGMTASFLENIRGSKSLLASYHLLKIKQREVKERTFNLRYLNKIINKNSNQLSGDLDQLLRKRISLYISTPEIQEKNVEEYCNFLSEKFNLQRDMTVNTSE